MISFKPGEKPRVEYKTRDLYKFYKEYTDTPVSLELYSNIRRDYFTFIYSKIINENFSFRLPFRLGLLRIFKFKRKLKLDENGNVDKSKLPVNYRATLNLWEKTYPGKTKEEILKIPNRRYIYMLNEHTNRYSVIFFWDKVSSNIPNQRFYKIDVPRDIKRKLAERLKTDKKLIDSYYEK
jgi:hypothetical protein